MSLPEDDDLDAAEYALGTLDAGERAAAEARRAREPDFARAIWAWEERLAPLIETAPEVAPPAGLLDLIRARLGAGGVSQGRVLRLQRKLKVWRWTAAGASALAACLALGFELREASRPTGPTSYVAMLQRDPNSPGFLVSVDTAKRTLAIRPMAAQAQPGRSYELWLVNPALGAPRSLGLVPMGDASARPMLASFDPGTIEHSTYAVTLEPQNGSPTGAPTGPILFKGDLVQTNF